MIISDKDKRTRRLGLVYSTPMGLWLSLFFMVPLLIIIIYSFLTKGLYGGVELPVTMTAYKQMFNPNFLRVLLRTLWVASLSTLLTIVLALPCGYAMARSKHQTFWLGMVIIPFWTNSLIRVYAWISILSSEGFVNEALKTLGIIKESLSLIYNQGAVITVLIYMYIPFAILPLFTTIDKFDFALLEAARDLGATKPQAIFKVLLPNIRSGIITSVIFTFIPIFGAYTVPLLVGGKDSYLIGNIIVDQVTKTRNWPLASAFSLIITLLSTLGVLWMMTSTARERARLKQQPVKDRDDLQINGTAIIESSLKNSTGGR
ncbi:MAG: ABC transporter permease [Sphaerochaetaceae bacterium]|nr:ABC transporter permease [Sphaerochaetaceae bacterium]NLO59649.1 ABC transporter permease [Spirochaetales bacterium]MDD2406084.1 ABC transporter permease [Sphaerochaetaceae bacterium]MDD3670027.1 ABC transporter permease [Sphaerochaetaceae bacterium]MDD4260303.1 ABC transporter permease [Sphaerochaetaceae bacterium]